MFPSFRLWARGGQGEGVVVIYGLAFYHKKASLPAWGSLAGQGNAQVPARLPPTSRQAGQPARAGLPATPAVGCLS